jgi:hypothetical protein
MRRFVEAVADNTAEKQTSHLQGCHHAKMKPAFTGV